MSGVDAHSAADALWYGQQQYAVQCNRHHTIAQAGLPTHSTDDPMTHLRLGCAICNALRNGSSQLPTLSRMHACAPPADHALAA